MLVRVSEVLKKKAVSTAIKSYFKRLANYLSQKQQRERTDESG